MAIDEVSHSGTRATLRSAAVAAYALLAFLLAVDLALIGGHILRVSEDQIFSSPWSIESDYGYPEKLQYAKWAAASLFMLALALKRRVAIYLGWAAVFLYFLLDDSQSLHERIGKRLAAVLDLERVQQFYAAWFPALHLRPRDLGELIVALAVGCGILALIALSRPARHSGRERTVTRWLLLWFVLFAFFAVGVDMAHIAIGELAPWTAYPMGVIEDGGEMICASLLVGGLAIEVARR